MRLKQLIAPVCLFLAIGSTPILAQDAAPAKLSLNEAVDRALGVNANLKQAVETRQTSLSRLNIARINTTYSLGSRATYDRASGDTSVSGRLFSSVDLKSPTGTEATLELSPFGTGSLRGAVGLTLRQPLMQGRGMLSNKGNSLLQARSNSIISNKRLYITEQGTIQNVIEAYFNAVAARERVRVQERAVTIAEEAAHGARRRAEEGLVPEIDVARAEIRVAETKEDLNQQHQNERRSLDRLMLAIGAGVGQTPELTDSVPGVPDQDPKLEDALKRAMDNRVELVIADEGLITQQRDLEISKDKLRPVMDLVAGFNYSKDSNGALSGSLFNLGSFTTGIEYRFPFDKRVDMEEQRMAARQLEVSKQLRALDVEQITEEVRNAVRSLQTTRDSLDILGQNLKIAEENMRIAQRMVDEGLSDNRNVMDAQDSLTRAENGVLSARIDLYLAYVNLKKAMGDDLTAVISK